MTRRTREADLRRIASDPAEFEAFYRQYVADITRFVTRRVSDPHLAADLTAEIFLAVIDSAHTYRPARGVPRAWLYGIARHVIAGHHRRAAGERRLAGRMAGHRILDDDDIARLEERIDAQREARHLYGALGTLPADERAVLELVAVDGLTVTEAAAALGIRPGTARVRLHRARRSARDALADPAVAHAQSPTPAENRT